VTVSVDVAVIGAGPYGLSVAAHLAARGIDYRIFGEPMRMWERHMPPGMQLKSDGKSSDLSDPGGALTLAEFCRARDLPYHRALLPVPVETFVAYGHAFQQRFAPHTEHKLLTRLERNGARFSLHFDDGEWLTANHVVLAVGMMAFKSVPDMFGQFLPSLASHSSAFGSLERLNGRDVVILGSGSSALDLAALLHERASRVTLVTRARALVFHGPPQERRSLLWRIRAPDAKIGAGWLLRVCDDAPQFIHALPGALRARIVRGTLGPSGGYFLRGKVLGKVETRLGHTVSSATARGDRIRLETQSSDGRRDTIEGDHLILATGYKTDMAKLGFLSPDILRSLRTVANAPVLSANFESSVSGLHFVGYASVPSFGPVMRFVAGAPHPARRLAWHLATQSRQSVSPAPLKAGA
jgi:thioredoxin reductase